MAQQQTKRYEMCTCMSVVPSIGTSVANSSARGAYDVTRT